MDPRRSARPGRPPRHPGDRCPLLRTAPTEQRHAGREIMTAIMEAAVWGDALCINELERCLKKYIEIKKNCTLLKIQLPPVRRAQAATRRVSGTSARRSPFPPEALREKCALIRRAATRAHFHSARSFGPKHGGRQCQGVSGKQASSRPTSRGKVGEKLANN